jgi:DNA-directed RNA polymerase specialized sigma24 family protein
LYCWSSWRRLSAVFLLREVFELDFDEIASSVGKSEANTRQILTCARGRLRNSHPRFTVSRRESEEIVRASGTPAPPATSRS